MRRFRLKSLSLLLATLLLPLSVLAFQAPYLSRPVMDEVGLLDDASKDRIETALRSLHREGKLQLTVYIPQSLQDLPIEDFAIRTAEAWKLGRKGQDEGLLLVIAPHERQMRLEVGYGLEGEITDAFSKHVLDDVLRPYFRDQRYGDGILAATAEIAQKLNRSADIPAVPPPRRAKHAGQRIPLPLLLFFIVIVLFIHLIARRTPGFRRGGRYGGGWGGGMGGGGWGGGSGGGWSGGGGGFGGGGASSSW